MRRVVVVPFSKPDTNYKLWEEVRKQVNGPDFSGILYIAPTPIKVENSRKVFSQSCSFSAFVSPQFFTLKQLANHLFAHFGEGFPFPEEFKSLLLFYLSGRTVGSLGLAKALGATIKDIKQYRPYQTVEILKEELANIFIRDEGHLKKIWNYLDIAVCYNQKLKEKGFFDGEDILNQAPLLIDHLKPKSGVLVLDGFYDLTPIEERFVERLIQNSEKVIALAYYDGREEEIYEIPKQFLAFLERRGFEKIRIDEVSNGLLEEEIYYEASDPETEVEAIASRVKEAILVRGVNPGNVLVTFPDIERYRHLVARTFFRYGIPVSIPAPRSLKESTPAQTVLSLLTCLEEDFPRIAAVNLFTSPFLPGISGPVRKYINSLSLYAGIIKGRKDWRNIGFYLREDRDRKKAIEKAGLSLEEISGIQQEVNRILKAVIRISRPKQDTLTNFVSRLRQFLGEFGWEEGLDQIDDKIVESIQSLFQLSSDFGSRFFTEKIGFAEFTKILRHLIDSATYTPEGKGVLAMGPLETRGLFPDYLFWGGLTEADFPRRPGFDSILPEYVKKKMGLPNLSDQIVRERLHFHRLKKTGFHRFFSFPRTSGDKLFLPSPFLYGWKHQLLPRLPGTYSIAEFQIQSGKSEGRASHFSENRSGVVLKDNPENLAFINQKFGPDAAIWITHLDDYLRCPYQFFLNKILGLEVRVEPQYDVEPKVWGSLAHRLLQEVYQKGICPVSELGKVMQDILPDILAGFRLGKVWREIASRIFFSLVPAIQHQEENLRHLGFLPDVFEKRISGSAGKGITLTGKIDRVDRSADGFLLIDYKTGKSPEKKEVGKTYLQIPLYAYLYEKKTGKRVFQTLIYSLVEPEANEPQPYSPQMGEEVVARVKEIVSKIREGYFPAEPRTKEVCRFCVFQAFCFQE